MTIAVGEKIPSTTLQRRTADGVESISTDDVFKGRKVVVFGVPAAFTPNHTAQQISGYMEKVDAIKGKGVDEITCIAVNDAYAMDVWCRDRQAEGKVTMLADGSGKLANTLGLELDLRDRGMGVRSQRYAMVVEDCVVKLLNVDAMGEFKISSAETVLAFL